MAGFQGAGTAAAAAGRASAAFAAAHLWRNALALGADNALYLGGAGFVSLATVLPAFAERLGASNLALGALPAVMTLGWFVPGVFTASHVEGLARKLPFVLKYTVFERLPLLLIALLTLALAASQPALVLAALLALLLLWSTASGVVFPAWLDLIGRVIPGHLRGRFFALSSAAGGALGIGAAAAASSLLAAYPFPLNYALCFGASFALMVVSFVALALVREPSVPPAAPAPPVAVYLRRLPAVLAGHPNFARYLAGRGLGFAGLTMGAGFYTVYALKALGASELHVGLFTLTLVACEAGATLGLGLVADRAGHKLVVALSSLSALAASLLALLATNASGFAVVFVLLGMARAGVGVSSFAILLEFASEHDRPTYAGLGSLAMVPFALAAPLLGGWLADGAGYSAVFALAATLSAVSTLLLAFGVRDPRTA
ncbi:MAG: MFS transporter [Chloroflexi bacterium]|nr:MFS transporter [Chloroflexota bacterium]